MHLVVDKILKSNIKKDTVNFLMREILILYSVAVLYLCIVSLYRFHRHTSLYLSFAKTALAYMGVGRNMGYSRARFECVGGFKGHYHIASGDDDLFIKDASTRKNTAIELSPETYVYTEAKETWQKWFSQKHRHFTTSGEYRLINKLFLGIFPLSMFLMHVCLFLGPLGVPKSSQNLPFYHVFESSKTVVFLRENHTLAM